MTTARGPLVRPGTRATITVVPGPDEINVREAVLDDAAACAGVHVRSWKAIYRGMIADDYLDDLTVEDRLPAWEAWLAEPKIRGCVLVADDQGRIEGFGSFVAHESLGPRWAYVPNLYLDPSAIGRGRGRALMQAGLDRLASLGYDHAELWTHIDNRRAQRF